MVGLTTFSFPTRTLFGPGALGELSAYLSGFGIGRPLVVTDAGLLASDAYKSLAKALGEDNRDKSWFTYAGVHSNPIENDVREAAAVFSREGCDAVKIGRAHV